MALIQELGIGRAHVMGLSLGAAIGMWLAGKYPDQVKTLSLHSGWHKTDAYIQTVITSLRFAEPLKTIKNSELVIFETSSHAPIYESAAEFNEKTLAFLQQTRQDYRTNQMP